MAKTKAQLIKELEPYLEGEDNQSINIDYLFNYFSSDELERFVEFVKSENE